ncbi:unnamed protein product [Rhizoctonia solani]|uniref:Uncharacterized protein n=1 Tax=Rhizoctonia solani TaxID=456999 RepID=A0A8H3B6T8_9AGAM|nr:unnamed protein product [Rhizoctonia solani]
MNTQQSAASAIGSKSDRRYFRGFHDDVNSDDEDGLIEQRLEQWRPFSQNPFINPDLGLTSENNRPRTLVSDISGDDEKAIEKPEMSRASTDLSQQSSISPPRPTSIAHAGPTWVNLFYDLAWTASFASLTQNGQLNEPWDTVSYTAFFVVVWWLWASQTLYSIQFYTNDWVHLLFIFIQLIIFGLLAATTRGYDVTAYILHSPGVSGLDPQMIDGMVDPERYQADRVADYSLRVIAVSLAISRTLLWVQHLRVFCYARVTAYRDNLLVPWKLYILPIGLSVSNALFWAAMGVTFSPKGRTPLGAKLKFVFWGVGLLVEFLLHWFMEHLPWHSTSSNPLKEPAGVHDVSRDAQPQPELLQSSSQPQVPTLAPTQENQFLPVPKSNVNLRERLEGITTVILGEGINGIAGTLYAIISAPGLGGPVAANIACAAIIVYFLAYLYFEGPTGRRDPKGGSTRKMFWLLLHLPFLLCIILLLLGQKLYLDEPASAINMPMKNFLLKRGIKWADEFNALNASVTKNGSISLDEVGDIEFDNEVGAWSMRISLKIMKQLYETFMGGDEKIPPKAKTLIDDYYVNMTLSLQDYIDTPEQVSSYHYETILTQLLEAHLQGARYIVALAAVILLSLGMMNRVHSRPRDRFQWGIILSRVCMGVALLFLLLLNFIPGHETDSNGALFYPVSAWGLLSYFFYCSTWAISNHYGYGKSRQASKLACSAGFGRGWFFLRSPLPLQSSSYLSLSYFGWLGLRLRENEGV